MVIELFTSYFVVRTENVSVPKAVVKCKYSNF